MKEKLDALGRRFDELTAQLSDPAVYQDMNAYKKITKEVAQLDPLVKSWRRLEDVSAELEEAKDLFEESDGELRELAREEVQMLTSERDELEAKIELLLLPKDPNDEKDIILEIRAGAGGEEAALFANDLFRMYSRFSERQKWRVELLSFSDSDNGGYKEVIASLSGDQVYSALKYEGGVHRVQRVPATESQGRIHTSTCTVAILPEAEDVELDVPEGELRIDTYRASGAGGQHVNKTESAIRITHLPTGTVVTCQDEKSQHKNKSKAMKVLKARLLNLAKAAQQAERTDERRSMVGTGDRSERIRTYNYPQGRVTDHRIGLTLYKLNDIINGELEAVINPVRAHVQATLLEEQKRDSI
jgi:peptide chain release factor 1